MRTKAEKELERYERSLVEVDGEFCVPQEEGQARHFIDLGPIFGEVERSPGTWSGSCSCSSPRSSCSSSPIQLMKTGASAVGPSIEGSFPFANPASTLGTGWLGAYFVLSGSPVAATTISLFGAGTLRSSRR